MKFPDDMTFEEAMERVQRSMMADEAQQDQKEAEIRRRFEEALKSCGLRFEEEMGVFFPEKDGLAIEGTLTLADTSDKE